MLSTLKIYIVSANVWYLYKELNKGTMSNKRKDSIKICLKLQIVFRFNHHDEGITTKKII